MGQIYHHADPRLSLKKIVSKSTPDQIFQVPSLNLTTYSDFKNRIESYPEQGTPESAKLVAVFSGQILIEDHGKYTFFFNSTAGSGVEIQDMKNTKNKLQLALKADGSAQAVMQLEAPQMIYVTAFFRAPPVGTDHVIDLQYAGPDTHGGKVVDVPGKHWINSLEEEQRMLQKSAHAIDCALGHCDKAAAAVVGPQDPAGLRAGFGCRFKYAPWKPADALPSMDALRAMVPSAAAHLPFLILPTLADMQAVIRAWHDQPWNRAAAPDGLALCYCEGLINITQSGPYAFTVEAHGSGELAIDGVVVVAERNASAPGAAPAALQGDISLPRGFHDLHLAALLCIGDACGRAPDAPLLRVTAAGPAPPEPADGAAPPASADPAPPAVPGYWEPDGLGDLSKLVEAMYKAGRAAAPYAGERNAFKGFDADWYAAHKDQRFAAPPSSVRDDEALQHEVAKIIRPMTDNSAAAAAYAADGAARAVPEGVYAKPAPYDSEVVDIGGKGIPWVHRESTNDLDGDAAVLGHDYVFTPWRKTLESVYEPSANLDYHRPEFGGGIATPPSTFGVGKEQ